MMIPASARYARGKVALPLAQRLPPFAARGRRARSGSTSSICFITVRASPTMGTSTLTFLLTLAGSTSTWTMVALLGELVELAGDAVVEPGADGDDEVGLGHRHVGGVRCRACRACRDDCAMPDGKHPRPMSVGVTGMLQLLGEREQLVGAVGRDHAAADVEDGLLGLAA